MEFLDVTSGTEQPGVPRRGGDSPTNVADAIKSDALNRIASLEIVKAVTAGQRRASMSGPVGLSSLSSDCTVAQSPKVLPRVMVPVVSLPVDGSPARTRGATSVTVMEVDVASASAFQRVVMTGTAAPSAESVSACSLLSRALTLRRKHAYMKPRYYWGPYSPEQYPSPAPGARTAPWGTARGPPLMTTHPFETVANRPHPTTSVSWNDSPTAQVQQRPAGVSSPPNSEWTLPARADDVAAPDQLHIDVPATGSAEGVATRSYRHVFTPHHHVNPSGGNTVAAGDADAPFAFTQSLGGDDAALTSGGRGSGADVSAPAAGTRGSSAAPGINNGAVAAAAKPHLFYRRRPEPAFRPFETPMQPALVGTSWRWRDGVVEVYKSSPTAGELPAGDGDANSSLFPVPSFREFCSDYEELYVALD